MDLAIIKKLVVLLTFFQNKRFWIDHFTGSKFRIDINNNLAVLMMSQPQHRITTLEASDSRFCNVFAGMLQNEDCICPPLLIEKIPLFCFNFE